MTTLNVFRLLVVSTVFEVFNTARRPEGHGTSKKHGVQTERSGLEIAVSTIIDVSGDGKEVSQGALLYLVVASSRGGLGGLVRLNTKASHTIAQGPIFELEKVCTATDAR